MKLYFTYRQLPELSGYTKFEQRIIWINFVVWREQREKDQKESELLAGLIIGGLLTGIVLGFFLIPHGGPFTPFIVGIAFMYLLWMIWHLWNLHAVRRPLRDYMTSAQFSLEPINQRARMFIRPLIWNRGEDDTQS
jgi:hypothetical protein